MAENTTEAVENSIFDAMVDEPAQEAPQEPVDAPEAAGEAPEEDFDEEEGVTLGSEEEDADEAVQDDSGITLEEVEYDGVIYEVPATLKDALLRQSDYTQKTQGLADKRKEIEVIAQQLEVTQKEQQFVAEIQPDLNNVGYLQAQIQQMENELQTNVANMTSEEMFRKKIEMDGFKSQLEAISGGLQAKYRDFEEAQKQSYQELLEKGAQVLKQVIPDWNEDKQREVRDYAIEKGFSPQEVSSIIDPRHVQILYDAQQYQKIKSKAKPSVAGVKPSNTIQPKGRPQKMDDAAKTRLKQNKIRNQKGLSNAEKADKLLDTKLDAFL